MPAALHVTEKDPSRPHDLRRRIRVPEVGRQRAATPKLTIPSPNMVHYRGGAGGGRRAHLPRHGGVLGRPVRRLRRRGRALGELGCTYLQFDDTSLAYLNDPRQREQIRHAGGNVEHLHEQYVRNINRALEGKPERHGGHHPPVPGQLPLLVGGRGKLRLRRRGAVRRSRRRRLLPRVRRFRSAGSSRCDSCPRASTWCSGWSRPSMASSNPRTCSSAGSRRPRSTCRSSSCACRRSAASPRPSRATCSARGADRPSSS